jgi:hypothetical protein
MSRLRCKHHGIAMMLVIVAVAIAAVLGYSTLAVVGTQAQISENSQAIAQADCLAESGFNYAMYQLENDSSSIPWSSGSLTLGNAASTYTSTLTSVGQGEYEIQSSGTVHIGAAAMAITRTVTAYVQLNTPAVPQNQAGGFTGNLPLNSLDKVVGNVQTAGTVTNTGASVSGSVTQNASGVVAPTQVTDFSVPYTYAGQTYSPTLLTSDPAAGTTLGPTASNPAGIYYVNNRLMNLKGITINGSLIIKSGGVSVTSATTNTITPVSGYPGLVINKSTSNVTGAGYLEVSGANAALTVNGLVWSQLGITKVGAANTGSQITINGSLLTPASSPFNSYNGALTLNYTAANVNVPNFSSQMSVPKNLKVLSWSQ